jgi:phytoene/squalene synthetase
LPPDLDLAAAEAWCRRVAESHYENFTVASRIVPSRLRQDLANVYAYARWSDDLADEAASPAAAGEAPALAVAGAAPAAGLVGAISAAAWEALAAAAPEGASARNPDQVVERAFRKHNVGSMPNPDWDASKDQGNSDKDYTA